MRHIFILIIGLTVGSSAPGAEPHWAFQPPKRPSVPGQGHPIDAFVQAERANHSLTARPPADKRTLLRRVTLDLIGIPPTPSELQAFMTDSSANAFEKVVDRLLASPRYGERWGRHFMDVWRYSDWDGFGAEIRNSQPFIWRWRDWIIESLNADKGYDRMILEMLAGDELEPTDPKVVRATGFLARNWFMFNRNVWLDNTIEHTSKAFLGLTMNCARCHDHKYDPISQREYYQFRAIFEAHEVRLDRVPGQPDTKKDGLPRVYDAHLRTPTYLFHRGDELKPDKNNELSPALPEFMGAKLKVEPVSLPSTAYLPHRRDFVIHEDLAAAEQNLMAAKLRALRGTIMGPKFTNDPLLEAIYIGQLQLFAQTQAELMLAQLKLSLLQSQLNVEALVDVGKQGTKEWEAAAKQVVEIKRQLAVAEARLGLLIAEQERSKAKAKPQIDAADKKVAVAKDVLAKALAAQKSPLTTAFTPRAATSYPATSTGRRLALAKWIADKNNPLTARVAVNHVWMRHFGQPLVPTVFDFGLNGKPPTHPELLDWLATELTRTNWSIKNLHRLIVTSSTYRQDSSPEPNSLRIDAENRFLWRFSPRRLEAEAVRDSVLHVAGNIDPTMGGPDIDQSLGLTTPRRSVYFRHSVEKYVEMLRVFDSANVLDCYRRDESIVPHQALAMANNTLVLAQARLLAKKLAEASPSPSDFISIAFERVLGRPPRTDEITLCIRFLEEQAVRLADRNKLTSFTAGPTCPIPPANDPAQRAREDLIHVLFNHHEFVTLR